MTTTANDIARAGPRCSRRDLPAAQPRRADSIDTALEATDRGIRAVKISFAALLVTVDAAARRRRAHRLDRAAGRHDPQLLRRADRGPAVPRVPAEPPPAEPPLHLRLPPRRRPRRRLRRRHDHPLVDRRRLGGGTAPHPSPATSTTSARCSPPASSGSSATSSSRSTASAKATPSAPPRSSPTATTPAPTASPHSPSPSARSACGPGSIAPTPSSGSASPSPSSPC